MNLPKRPPHRYSLTQSWRGIRISGDRLSAVGRSPSLPLMAEAFGLEVGDLPEGWKPIEVIAVVKCVDLDDGTTVQSIRATPSLDQVEGLGMLEIASTLVRRDAAASFDDGE